MEYVTSRLREIAEEAFHVNSKNIERAKTRHGKIVTYYRVGKGKRFRLPNANEVTETEFARAYHEAASAGKAWTKPRRVEVKGEFGPPGKPGYVYFVREKSSVKIGFTTAIKSRMKSIQTSCADPLEILMVMPATTETEKFLHRMFADYRIGGEWFSLTGLLAEFVGYKEKR